MGTVRYDDISAAFDFVSFAAPMEHSAYVSLDTGTIYWVSELNPLDEEVPDDLGESDRYLAIPHMNDLDLGSNLALRFAAEELPDRYASVEGFFGAVVRTLASKHSLQRRAGWTNGTRSRLRLLGGP